jgi:hypothetical protein
MRILIITALLISCFANIVTAQQYVDKVKFFEDTTVVNATLTVNFKKLMARVRQTGLIFPATFTFQVSADSIIKDNLEVEARGHFRREECYMPPLKLIYKNNKNAAFYKLKELKLVSPCRTTKMDDQNLLREYLIYKIYNRLTDKSFRVRLLHLTYIDSNGSKKPITQYAFLMEDIKELAKRNESVECTEKRIFEESTNREHMTKVALFQYMIGNADWSIPYNHNIRIIRSSKDSTAKPFVVPYDFDFSGLVNAGYAVPDDRLNQENIRQRVYRGNMRTEAEIKIALETFTKEKDNFYAIINNCSYLLPETKKDMIDYLSEFYTTIKRPQEVKQTFIDGARQ